MKGIHFYVVAMLIGLLVLFDVILDTIVGEFNTASTSFVGLSFTTQCILTVVTLVVLVLGVIKTNLEVKEV